MVWPVQLELPCSAMNRALLAANPSATGQ